MHKKSKFITYIDKKLDELSNLKYNWDSYGAKPIKLKYMRAVKKFTSHFPDLTIYPFVIPINDGRIQLEFYTKTKELILEFEKPRVIYYYKTAIGIEGEGSFDIDDICKSIELLHWIEND